ncbi:MAG: hypothetical protein RL088_1325 [Verrucomicrobiota bacterium]|jgi:mono/diheme cytochrome c family protein
MRILFPLLAVATLAQAEPLSPELALLSAEARGVLAHNCTKCHGQHKQKGGLRLDLRDAAMKGGESGAAIKAGKPDESELLRRVMLPKDDDEIMPPEKGPLDPKDAATLRKWIAAGAPWPEGETAGIVFQRAPIAPRTPPFPAGTENLENPVDKFVDAYFREKQIAWPAIVDDRTFLRRASLDVIGLLPDWREVAAFDGNRAKAVDALLARKQDYAAHWLTFWNDALRNDYSGVGYIDGGRSQISQWLHRALSTDMPYDQFVRELVTQVPGAEGFIKGIKWRGDVSAGQRVELQAAEGIGQVFLGVNVKCASCHDSFISDYTLKDSHALAAVFSDKPLDMFRCDKPTGEKAAAAFFWPELGSIKADAPKAEKRAQLAAILTKKENGRLARVMVNRLWTACFGRGLCEPVDALDNPPWSRDLLDWLAADFAANGYRVTRTLKLILTSRAYQLHAVEIENADDLAKSSFVFRGPVVRRLSAEQFTDALSRIAAPLYRKRAFIPGDKGGAAFAAGAQWIWHDEADGNINAFPQGKRYFRAAVEFPKGRKPRLARVVGTADNTLVCFVNGRQVLDNKDWDKASDADATEAVAGATGITVAVEADNIAPGAAGLRLAIAVWFEGTKTPLVLATGPGWRSIDKAPRGWEALDLDDSQWTPAITLGPEGLPWGGVNGFTLNEQSGLVRAAFVDNDPLQAVMGRPIRDQINMSRPTQATLLQALTFTNGKTVSTLLDKAGAQWTTRFPDAKARLTAIYQAALLREPREDEFAFAAAAPADLLWSVLLLPEFQLIR